MTEKVPLYDEFSESYDVMVSWEERLEREEPFFRDLFSRAGAHRVLDVGTATGWHAAHFAQMGLESGGGGPVGRDGEACPGQGIRPRRAPVPGGRLRRFAGAAGRGASTS